MLGDAPQWLEDIYDAMADVDGCCYLDTLRAVGQKTVRKLMAEV